MTIRFKNTLSGVIEEFSPIASGEARMYTCGPTVYNYAHIGNFRAYVFEDLLRRFLKVAGFKVTQVMNITDIDDKTIRDSNACGKSLADFTEFYTSAFFEDLTALNIEPAEHYPRATAHIPEMIAMIEKLRDAGLTYEKDGSTYFRISSFPAYGRLSGVRLDQVKSGLRYDTDEYEKDDVRDFVLWKAWREGEPSWDSPFGKGRPGWHIECSAMSRKLLGPTFAIHTGGVDNIFPHHENEIAQSECANGVQFVKYWLHCEHLVVDGKKMSKSAGNFYTLRDLIKKGYSAPAVRWLLLSAHYRSKLNFTMEGLDGCEKGLKKFHEFCLRLRDLKPSGAGCGMDFLAIRDSFLRALSDDLNISEALAVFHQFLHDANEAMTSGTMSLTDKEKALESVDFFDDVLGIAGNRETEVPERVLKLAADRWLAKSERRFQDADRLRGEVAAAGFRIDDSKEGYRVLPL
ncbi:MAG: cysteine--tRNA ligase [Candidatus Wallbacteria bacterium]|nr:cysteine--tRNA ligase [Candidatus Wallbacteria bacterium]